VGVCWAVGLGEVTVLGMARCVGVARRGATPEVGVGEEVIDEALEISEHPDTVMANNSNKPNLLNLLIGPIFA